MGKGTVHNNSTIYKAWMDIQYLQPSKLAEFAMQLKWFLFTTKYPVLSRVKEPNPSVMCNPKNLQDTEELFQKQQF